MTTRAELIDALDQLVAPFETAARTTSPRREVHSETPPPRVDEDTVAVTLSRTEALSGARRTVTVTATERCPRCHGTGVLGFMHRCGRCDGSGLAPVERRLRVRIPPRIEHGTVLVVRGEGGAAGDLFVRVNVQ
jgi:DnaJ-class molecular chaperone